MYKAFIHSMLLIAAANAQYVSTRTVTALVCPQRSFTTIQTSSTSTTIRTPLSTFTTSATSSQGVGIPVWNEGPPVPQSVTTRSTTTTTTTTSRATVGVPAFNSQPPAAPSSQDIPKPLLRTNTTTTPYTTVTYTVVPFQTLVANNTTFTPISSPTNGILNPPTDIATAPSSTSVGLQNGGDTPVSPTGTNPSNGASVFVGEAPSKCVWDVMSSLVVMIAVWFAVM